MWIRTQDKETLINVNCIDMYNINKHKWIIEACDSNNLGTYESKERALEVLDEIQEKIINLEYGKAYKCLMPNEVVYQMPEE